MAIPSLSKLPPTLLEAYEGLIPIKTAARRPAPADQASLNEFYFRWFENSVIEIGEAASI